jgi:hypothetical protein
LETEELIPFPIAQDVRVESVIPPSTSIPLSPIVQQVLPDDLLLNTVMSPLLLPSLAPVAPLAAAMDVVQPLVPTAEVLEKQMLPPAPLHHPDLQKALSDEVLGSTSSAPRELSLIQASPLT